MPAPADNVILDIVGPPISSEETGQSFLYEIPKEDPRFPGGGMVEQAWSFLGREDRAASMGNDEYPPSICPIGDNSANGTEAAVKRIVETAKTHRVVIINESHVVTRHRDFSRQVIVALRPHGFTTLAAETFHNVNGEPDPVETYANLPYVHQNIGWYSREPVFGQMLREAKALGYRFVAYEEVSEPREELPDDWRISIRDRETAQARNLAEIFANMPTDEKLVVHVGYGHASEAVSIGDDGWESAWMAARLKRDHGVDPLTVAQTVCSGSGADTILLVPSGKLAERFDLVIDHPVYAFEYGRTRWRFRNGKRPVEIPKELQPTDSPLVIEAFAAGEPFESIPVDRVWVDPGEDVRLALRPGRYTVRAVIPPMADDKPTTP